MQLNIVIQQELPHQHLVTYCLRLHVSLLLLLALYEGCGVLKVR